MRKEVVVGYSVRKKRRFRSALLAAIVIVVLLVLWLVSLKPEKEKKPAPAAEKAVVLEEAIEVPEQPAVPIKVEILDRATSRKIREDNLPQEISRNFSAEEKVYCYNRVMFEQVPAIMKHIWVNPEGAVYAVIPLTITRQPADSWSYITLPPESPGAWSIRMMVGDKLVDKLEFRVD